MNGTIGGVFSENVRWETLMKHHGTAYHLLKSHSSPGWTALHHVRYFRAKLTIQEEGVYLFTFRNVISYKIDKDAYVGNVYGYSRAAYTPVRLSQGDHTIYVQTMYDVRLHGGYF